MFRWLIIPVSAVSVVFTKSSNTSIARAWCLVLETVVPILMGVVPVACVINENDTVDVHRNGAVALKASSRVLIPVVMVPSGGVRSNGAKVILHGVRGPVLDHPVISHKGNMIEFVHALVIPVLLAGFAGQIVHDFVHSLVWSHGRVVR